MLIEPSYSFKKLTKKTKNPSGRNSSGKITVRHKGGGSNPRRPLVDYNRPFWNIPAYVKSIEKCKYLSCFLALLVYPIGIITYILAPENLKVGSFVVSGVNVPTLPGCSSILRFLPFNTKLHNIEAYPGSGAKYIRSCGTWAKILEKKEKTATLLFNNGNKKTFLLDCQATIGALSNSSYKTKFFYKNAGEKRLKNFRPHVRGVAMNPVDHPHGGGKGKKSPPSSNYNFKRRLPKGKKTS